jgi:hypothetical protein
MLLDILVTLVTTSAAQAAILIRTQMELHLGHLHSAVCTASHSTPLALFTSFTKRISRSFFKEIPALPVSIFTYLSVNFLPVHHHHHQQRDGQITRAGSLWWWQDSNRTVWLQLRALRSLEALVRDYTGEASGSTLTLTAFRHFV